MAAVAAGIGFTRLSRRAHPPVLRKTTDNVLRVTFDSVGNQWFSLRTKFEHAERRGEVTEEA